MCHIYGAHPGDSRLLKSQGEGCLTHIHLLIFKPEKVYRHATQVNRNTTVTFCWSKCDLYKMTRREARTPKYKDNNSGKLQKQQYECSPLAKYEISVQLWLLVNERNLTVFILKLDQFCKEEMGTQSFTKRKSWCFFCRWISNWYPGK